MPTRSFSKYFPEVAPFVFCFLDVQPERPGIVSFSVSIIAFCKKDNVLDEEIGRYCKLCTPFAPVSVTYLKSPSSSAYPKHELLEVEASIMRLRVRKNSTCVALSEEGKILKGSHAFAQWVSTKMQDARGLTFLIGGAYGLSSGLKNSCSEVISLSPLTFAHKLCLVVLLEQVYRAFTILRNHPYHK
jgi:23S rRNA (pseudouridine1915-N3)-methyltransferase